MTQYRCTSICLLLLLFFVLCPARLPAVVDVNGTIDADTTWTAADIIRLSGIITVSEGAQLTILPGAVIQGSLYSGFQIQGSLSAIGDDAHRISFTSTADTVGGEPVAGGWGGIWIDYGTAVIRGCDVRYTGSGIQAYGGALEVDSCLVENFLDRGIYVDGGSSLPRTVYSVAHTVVRQSDPNLMGTGTGIYAARLADITLTRCRSDHCRTGVTLQAAGTLNPYYEIAECEIKQNSYYGIYSYASG